MTMIRSSLPGFTLVELLVTMAIFIGVITIATGALFSAQSVNTRLEQTQKVLDGVNLATEVIVRDMRYGSDFYCDTSLPSNPPMTRRQCAYPNGGTVLIFKPTIPLSGSTNPDNDRVAYYLSNGMLYKNEYPSGGAVMTKQITSSDVNVQKLSFYSSGLANIASSDYNQPLITFVLSGITIPLKRNVQPVSFSVQTGASSRTLDR